MVRMKPFVLPAAALALSSASVSAAISYPTFGATLTENFNSLSSATSGTTVTWENNVTIPGWYALTRVPSPSTTFATYTTSAGSTAAAGALQSLGSGSDRALGSQNSNTITQSISYGVQITNNTGSAINAFNLQYAGEQWRAISNEIADGLTFDYQIFSAGSGSLDAASGWTSVSALDFTAPVTTTSSSSVAGNTTGRVLLSSDITGISWGADQELWLRWSDNSTSGNRRAAVSIDDVSFTAIPEPGFALLGGLGALSLLRRRR